MKANELSWVKAISGIAGNYLDTGHAHLDATDTLLRFCSTVFGWPVLSLFDPV